jgi:hypothetical protein
MELDTARNMIANHEGWNREDILKAATVLSRALPPNQGSGGKPPPQTAREIVQEEQREACGRLLMAMAIAQQLTLEMVYSQVGHSEHFQGVRDGLKNSRIIFHGTLDRK